MKNIKVKDSRVYALAAMYDMQTGLFKNALEDINDTDAHSRLETKANHIAWLAGSMVQQRYEMAELLGKGIGRQQADDLFKDMQGIKDDLTYPSLEQYVADWEKITPAMREAIVNADAETLDKMLDMDPDMKFTYFEMLYFMNYREASIIGQIALWRRLLGYDAMKYM